MGSEPWSCLFRIADFEFSLQGTDRQLRELAECVYSGARIADGKGAGVTGWAGQKGVL